MIFSIGNTIGWIFSGIVAALGIAALVIAGAVILALCYVLAGIIKDVLGPTNNG